VNRPALVQDIAAGMPTARGGDRGGKLTTLDRGNQHQITVPIGRQPSQRGRKNTTAGPAI
jgi:hypothetical protein